VNGLVITRLKVNPLIATLGVGLLLQGFLSASFNNFSGEVAPSFQSLAYGAIGVVPISPLLLAATALLGAFALRYTRFGAHVFAVGGDSESARLSGIRSDRVVILTHVIASLCAVLTGLYLASRLRAGAPWIGRAGVYDMESIAVTVIGGTSFSGGRGSIGGTIAGVLVFGILDSLFNQLGINAYLKQVLRGFIIVGAISSYTWRSREEPA
jgi:ribose transport system permease protein